jgi:hypothetical protein
LDHLARIQDYLGNEAIALGTLRPKIEPTQEHPEWKRGLVGFHPKGPLLGGCEAPTEEKNQGVFDEIKDSNPEPVPSYSEPELALSSDSSSDLVPATVEKVVSVAEPTMLAKPPKGQNPAHPVLYRMNWWAGKTSIALLCLFLMFVVPVILATTRFNNAWLRLAAFPPFASSILGLLLFITLVILNPKAPFTADLKDPRRMAHSSFQLRFWFYLIRSLANLVGLFTWGLTFQTAVILRYLIEVEEASSIIELYPLWLLGYQVAYEVHMRPLLAYAHEEIYGPFA